VKHLFAVAMCCVSIASGASKPVLRAVIESTRPIIVGQRVRLEVTVLVPNYFLGEPQFPQLNIENAIVVPRTETPQNSNEGIGAETFAGITVTYLVYPQQPGSFQIPPAGISTKYSSNPPELTHTRILLPPLSFQAVIPPQAADLDYFLPTTSLTITQSFDKPLANLRVGDTVTRTVTITASKMPAMLIPPIEFEAPEGIVVYGKQPVVTDIKTDRGEFVNGKRMDSVTYLIRKEGQYTLPAIQLTWWNLWAHKLQTASLAAVEVIAAPNPEYHPEIAPEPESAPLPARSEANSRKRRLITLPIVSIVAIGLLALMSYLAGRRLVNRWVESRHAHANSEAAAFSALRTACRKGQAKDAYRLLLIWLSRFSPGERVNEFLSTAGDEGSFKSLNLLRPIYTGPQGQAHGPGSG
jgi:oxygen tolerance protein BatD